MASATETPPAPAEATSAVARVLKEALGADVLKVEEFRGDLAITVAPSAWVRAATLDTTFTASVVVTFAPRAATP